MRTYSLPERLMYRVGQIAGLGWPFTWLFRSDAVLHKEAARCIDALTAERDNARRALRLLFCPRPCNHRPDHFDVGDCFDAGECGCVASHGLTMDAKTVSRDGSTVEGGRQ